MVWMHVLSECKIWYVYTWGVVDLCRVLLKYTHDISLGLINLWECFILWKSGVHIHEFHLAGLAVGCIVVSGDFGLDVSLQLLFSYLHISPTKSAKSAHPHLPAHQKHK